jgi:hypothetical protein
LPGTVPASPERRSEPSVATTSTDPSVGATPDPGPPPAAETPARSTVAIQPEAVAPPPLEAPADGADEQDTNSRVAAILRENPRAKSKDIGDQIGKKEQTVRCTPAWKENRQRLKEQNQKRAIPTKPLSRAMLASIDSGAGDPAEMAAETEEQEIRQRAGLDDPQNTESLEVLERRYLEGADRHERARLHELSRVDQEHELTVWRLTGVRQAD